MTRERINDLRIALLDYGWVILNEENNEQYPPGIYEPERGSMTWGIERKRTKIELDFDIRRFTHTTWFESKGLNDIEKCTIRRSNTKLIFSKRNSLIWRNDLKRFIENINNAE